MLYAQFKPATYDLTGINQMQMDALVEALATLVRSNRAVAGDLTVDEAERLRLQSIGAMELLDATKPARRAAAAIEEDD